MELKRAESVVSVAIGMILKHVGYPITERLSVFLTFTNISKASSERLFAQSQRGLSGTNHMPKN